jgi:hypothetical protein
VTASRLLAISINEDEGGAVLSAASSASAAIRSPRQSLRAVTVAVRGIRA